jgi:hypothetical protein
MLVNSSGGLVDCVNWEAVLDRLELKPLTSSLPTLIDCPFCKHNKKTIVYPDPFYKSPWFYCKECHKSGDIISIAAAIWQVDEATAARNFMAWKLIPNLARPDIAIDTYENKVLKPRIKHMEFWEQCKKSMLPVQSGEIRDLMTELEIPIPTNIDFWHKGGGNLIGFCDKKKAEQAVSSYYGALSDESTSRLFGQKVNNLLVIPMFDVPGRIREFIFIGRENGKAKVFSKYLSGKKTQIRCAAMAFFDAICRNTTHDNLVVTDDLLMAIRLQAKHTYDNKTPLNLVYMKDTVNAGELKLFGDFNFIVHNPKVSNGTFSRLKTHNVSVYVPREHENKSIINKLLPKVLMEKINSEKQSVLDVLEVWLKGRNKIEAQAAVGSMEFTLDDKTNIEKGVYPNIKTVIEELPEFFGKTVKVFDDVYYETESGWYHKDSNKLISSVKIDISKMATSSKGVCLVGSMHYQGNKISFYDSAGAFEKNPYEYTRHILMKNGLKVTGIDKKNNDLVYQLAVSFSNPVVGYDYDQMGWEKDNGLFRFASFSVDTFGSSGSWEMAFSKPTDFPTSRLINEPLSGNDLQELTVSSKTNASIWSVTASVVSCMLSSAVGAGVKRFVYYGETAAAVETVCEWLGVTPVNFSPNYKLQKNWPHVFPLRNRKDLKESFGDWFSTRAKPPCLVGVEGVEAYMIKLLDPSWAVVKPNFGVFSFSIADKVSRIIPTFLPWVLKKYGLDLPYDRDLTRSVLLAMEEWLDELSVNRVILLSSKSQLKLDSEDSIENRVEAFKNIIEEGVFSGIISEEEHDGTSLRKTKSAILFKNVVALSKDKLLSVFKANGFNLVEDLDLSDVEAFLEGDYLPSGLSKDDYYAINKKWWDDTVKTSRTLKLLKLSGT